MTASTTTGTRRRLIGLGQIVAIWGMAIVLVDGAVWHSGWFFRRYPSVSPDAPTYSQERLQLAERVQPQVVAMGNSRMLMGFRPALLGQATGMTARGQRACNLAISGAPLNVNFLVLRRLLALPVTHRPRVILLGVSEFDMTADFWAYNPADLHHSLVWPDDVPLSVVGWPTWIDVALERPWMLWRYRRLCNQIIGQKAQLLAAKLRRAPSAAPADPLPASAATALKADQELGYMPPTGPDEHLPAPPGNRGVAPTYQPWYLRRFVDLCHTNGVSCVLVAMPAYGPIQTPSAAFMPILRASGANAVVDLRQAIRQSRYWHDANHLNVAGATKATQLMAEQLATTWETLSPR